ncbi:MAG: 50S ribosomal protein L15 [Dehalococcoidia bacterium]
MMEHLISPSPGARKARKRIGRGDAAGQGSYAGRGMKGQKSRSGKSVMRGFEGGQLRMIKGLPMKRGFHNMFKTEYSLIKLDTLDAFEAGAQINPDLLRERGLLRGRKNPVKILGDGQVTKSVMVAAHKFTRSAREKIEAAGGTVQEL